MAQTDSATTFPVGTPIVGRLETDASADSTRHFFIKISEPSAIRGWRGRVVWSDGETPNSAPGFAVSDVLVEFRSYAVETQVFSPSPHGDLRAGTTLKFLLKKPLAIINADLEYAKAVPTGSETTSSVLDPGSKNSQRSTPSQSAGAIAGSILGGKSATERPLTRSAAEKVEFNALISEDENCAVGYRLTHVINNRRDEICVDGPEAASRYLATSVGKAVNIKGLLVRQNDGSHEELLMTVSRVGGEKIDHGQGAFSKIMSGVGYATDVVAADKASSTAAQTDSPEVDSQPSGNPSTQQQCKLSEGDWCGKCNHIRYSADCKLRRLTDGKLACRLHTINQATGEFDFCSLP